MYTCHLLHPTSLTSRLRLRRPFRHVWCDPAGQPADVLPDSLPCRTPFASIACLVARVLQQSTHKWDPKKDNRETTAAAYASQSGQDPTGAGDSLTMESAEASSTSSYDGVYYNDSKLAVAAVLEAELPMQQKDCVCLAAMKCLRHLCVHVPDGDMPLHICSHLPLSELCARGLRLLSSTSCLPPITWQQVVLLTRPFGSPTCNNETCS